MPQTLVQIVDTAVADRRGDPQLVCPPPYKSASTMIRQYPKKLELRLPR
jgi:hypothetical protein